VGLSSRIEGFSATEFCANLEWGRVRRLVVLEEINMKIRLCLFAAVLCSFVLASAGAAQPPQVAGDPSIGIVSGFNMLPSPPNVPKVGDIIESTWATFVCDPGCDPTQPDADPKVGNRTVNPSAYGPPVGISIAWERCSSTATSSCRVVLGRSFDRSASRYTVTDADVGFMIRSAIYATNLDCGYPRSYDNHQECRYEMRGVYSKLTARVVAPTVPVLPTVAVGPAAIPDGTVGQPYSATLTATSGTGPSFDVSAGTLPAGITLSAAGVLSGTPTAGGNYAFTVRATATGAQAGTRNFTLRIGLVLQAATLPAGTTGAAYTTQLTPPAGATAPVTWKFVSGKIAAGLSFDPNGTVSGRPTEAGVFIFGAEATDAKGGRGAANFTLTVNFPTLTLAASRLPDARQGVRYRFQVAPEGGTLPYAFAFVSGKLPKGVNFGPKGLVWGKPLVSGVFKWQAMVKDAFGAQQQFQLELRIKLPLKKKRR